MSPYETITISYDIVMDAGEHVNWILTSESAEEYTLEGTGEITIPTEETFTLERKAIIPIIYTLHQNYPNPFNPITSLRYDLPEQEQVTLTIYDLIGRESNPTCKYCPGSRLQVSTVECYRQLWQACKCRNISLSD